MRWAILVIGGVALRALPAAGVPDASFQRVPAGEAAIGSREVDIVLDGAGAASDWIFAQRVLDEESKPKKKPEEEEARILRPKNPFLALGLSAAVPGAGQFYVDRSNLLWSVLYAGVEATAWFLHFSWDSDGDERTSEYEEYAWTGALDPVVDAPQNKVLSESGHWSWVRWREGYRDGIPGCDLIPSIRYPETDSMLVQFWFNNRGEFYEDIGKYDKYACGWLDPGFRAKYLSMRNEANDLYDRSRMMKQVVLLNHVGSALHAFFIAKRHNRRLEPRTELRWDVSPDPGGALRAQLSVFRKF